MRMFRKANFESTSSWLLTGRRLPVLERASLTARKVGTYEGA